MFLLVALSPVTKRFRPPAGGRATFSLRAQRESSQRERAPRGDAFRPSMDGKSVSRSRAFRAGSCPREKALPSLATPAARPSRPRLTAAEGPPEKQARIVRARSNSKSRAPPVAGALALLKSARWERAALPGAP